MADPADSPGGRDNELGQRWWQPAADREGRVAVGHQRRDQRLSVHVGELENLQAARDQPAFATYQPDDQGRLVANGLQVLQLADLDGQLLITALVSYRDPGLAIRCGLPAALP